MNEIKEILVQMYAYAGFPRSLNGINTFITIMDERRANGIKDEIGKEASPVPVDINRMGLTEAQMKDFIVVLETKVGKKEAEIASEILNKVLDNVKHSH